MVDPYLHAVCGAIKQKKITEQKHNKTKKMTATLILTEF